MINKIAICLLALSCATACTTTQSTAKRETLADRMVAQNSTNANAVGEPMPPAEGPEDIPAEGPIDPNRNPGLLPTPLLRANAAAGL